MVWLILGQIVITGFAIYGWFHFVDVVVDKLERRALERIAAREPNRPQEDDSAETDSRRNR